MDQEKIGKMIKEIRKNNNLTQADLANKYNVTYQAVSKWENGKNIPDISILKQMSKDFNIDINDLLDGETSKKKIKTSYYIIGIIIILFIISSTHSLPSGISIRVVGTFKNLTLIPLFLK